MYVYIIGARLFVQSSHDPTNTEEGKVDIDFSQPNPNLSITIGKYSNNNNNKYNNNIIIHYVLLFIFAIYIHTTLSTTSP